jgi:phage tail-like protein
MPVPFTAFNFAVEISVPDLAPTVCGAAFAECDGLEMTQEVKTVRSGGENAVAYRLAGPAGYGQVTLKRGVTDSTDLWAWMAASLDDPTLRGDGEVVLLAEDGLTERARFVLERCLPVRVKAPPLNARDGLVAIEELGLVCDRISLRSAGGGIGLGIGIAVSAEVSL